MRGGRRASGAGRLGVAAATLALVGCSGGEPAGQSPASQVPAPAQTTLAAYDVAGAVAARAPFCDRVSPTGIEHALGDVPESHEEHGNGDLFRLPDGSRSVSHEYGCSWTALDGTAARAWVFAPPVTPARARRLAADAAGEGCTRVGSGDFGKPSVALRCRTEDGVESSWRGLLGDGWLTCTLGPVDDPVRLEERTEEWCVAVLDAARA
jgi:hypothetical protein